MSRNCPASRWWLAWRSGFALLCSPALAACAPTLVPLEPRAPRPDITIDAPPSGPRRPARTAAAAASAELDYFGRNPLMVPVAGVEPRAIRNSFNDPRSGGRIHRAYDIPAPRGTPVVAAVAGSVLAKRNNRLGGITLYLVDHEREFVYYYAHLDRYARGVNEGDNVEQGRVLGYVGTTGNAPPTFPHLHFQVLRVDPRRRDWWNGPAVDVLDYFSLTGSDGSR